MVTTPLGASHDESESLNYRKLFKSKVERAVMTRILDKSPTSCSPTPAQAAPPELAEPPSPTDAPSPSVTSTASPTPPMTPPSR